MAQRSMVGRVVSNKMQKTVIVEVEKTKRHPLYKKSIVRRSGTRSTMRKVRPELAIALPLSRRILYRRKKGGG